MPTPTIPVSEDSSAIRFADFPSFKPIYTPRECLQLGIFGGAYFGLQSARYKIAPELFSGLAANRYAKTIGDDSINYFEVASHPRNRCPQQMPASWKLIHQHGWFQWYARFYYGDRCQVDGYRIMQWADEILTLFFYIRQGADGDEAKIADLTLYKSWRQALLGFGWDPTQDPITAGIKEPY